jgi:alpha-beta hydrolase superfamily lysophospholipase
MKRDELDLAAIGAAVDSAPAPVRRQPLYFGEGADALFGWYHRAERTIRRDVVAVVCAPIGPEYTRSHRTVRHLADRLARAGVPTLRFDYHGVGDSAGDEHDPDRVGDWKRSIVAAVREARRLSRCERVVLIGVRLGATLAALEAQEAGADLLVLWNPVVKGRSYVRELQAIAMTARNGPAESLDGLESAGFRVASEALDALRRIDLTAGAFPAATRVLLVGRDDFAADGALPRHLAKEGIEHDVITVPGWNAMMADHQFTVVPDEALAAIAGWTMAHSLARPAERRMSGEAPTSRELGAAREELVHFGADERLFGILTRPESPTGKPAILMLNAGSIHHVGPHRLYVRLARELAHDGYATLRLDHEGLGDSVLRGPGRENHPYPEHALDDVDAAMAFLRERFGHERFIVLGLCSGAHTAFHAGLAPQRPIEQLLLINPWYFYWSEGLSLDTSVNHYEKVAAYQRSMRDPERWKKLLLGQVQLGRLAKVAGAHAMKVARGRWQDLKEVVRPGSGTRLSHDIRALAELDRKTRIYVSDGEPAGAVLATEAKRSVRKATRAGLLTFERIPGGDHTFSQSAHRDELVARVRAALKDPTPRSPA